MVTNLDKFWVSFLFSVFDAEIMVIDGWICFAAWFNLWISDTNEKDMLICVYGWYGWYGCRCIYPATNGCWLFGDDRSKRCISPPTTAGGAASWGDPSTTQRSTDSKPCHGSTDWGTPCFSARVQFKLVVTSCFFYLSFQMTEMLDIFGYQMQRCSFSLLHGEVPQNKRPTLDVGASGWRLCYWLLGQMWLLRMKKVYRPSTGFLGGYLGSLWLVIGNYNGWLIGDYELTDSRESYQPSSLMAQIHVENAFHWRWTEAKTFKPWVPCQGSGWGITVCDQCPSVSEGWLDWDGFLT